ncbi:hypothetical protein ElyMa_002575200 [Elysia marginata]|uniref:Uncharacterized protein n=1 Tax=Elysia marginata TaxID=1093978 RepID=A0AAV4GXV0_9GAST|nr:hypothetical protein ElyMa_002575200 [Elysia marginata]
MLPWTFRSKSLLSTVSLAHYPGLSGLRAYCLPLDCHATLSFPVQKPTVYRYTGTLSWAFQSKSLLFTARPLRYPGSSGPRAYCLPLTKTLAWAFRSKSILSTTRPGHYPGSSGPRA